MNFSLPLWPSNAADAIAIQKTLVGKVRLVDDHGAFQTIAGIDCSYDMRTHTAFSVATVMRVGEWKPIQTVRAALPVTFPYIPGLLSFREIPVIMEALKQLPALPDVLMVDGQGVAHPRRLGIAAHLGVLLDCPTVGVAKSLLAGRYKEPGATKGDVSPLLDKGEKIGAVLRSKDGVKPIFISPGHRISHNAALALTLQALVKHRLPEPTRIADKVSKDKPWSNSYADLISGTRP